MAKDFSFKRGEVGSFTFKTEVCSHKRNAKKSRCHQHSECGAQDEVRKIGVSTDINSTIHYLRDGYNKVRRDKQQKKGISSAMNMWDLTNTKCQKYDQQRLDLRSNKIFTNEQVGSLKTHAHKQLGVGDGEIRLPGLAFSS